MHEPPEATSAASNTEVSVPSVSTPELTEEDEKLAAYNRYLADLHAADDRKPR